MLVRAQQNESRLAGIHAKPHASNSNKYTGTRKKQSHFQFLKILPTPTK